MKDNLKVVHYRNGDLIGTTIDTTNICTENTPKYQWTVGNIENSLHK